MRRLLCVAAACAAFVSCRKEEARPAGNSPPPPSAKVKAPPPPPQDVQEIEPNDFQHAQAIPERAVVAGSLAPPRPRSADEDWYRLEPRRKLALRLELKPVGEARLDAWLELYDRDRNRLVRVHAGGEDKGVIPAAACSDACFVKVSGTVAAPYQLVVLGDDPVEGRELEPNDRAVDATPLAPGQPMQGTFLSGEDEDWYRLSISALQPGQFLRVELTGVDGVRPELEVRALSDGALLASFRAAGAGQALFVRDLSMHLGEAAAKADAGAAISAPDAGASFSAPDGAVISAPDAGASISAPDAGAVISAPDAGAVVSAPAAGVTISAPDAGASIPTSDAGPAISAPAAGAASAAPDGAVAISAPDAGAFIPASAAPAPAGYYLVLKSGVIARNKRGAAPLVPYTLTASLEAGAPDLEQEPNDDPRHASPMETTATGWIAPAGDQDWYRVHTDAPSVLRAEVSGVERADIELAVYGPAPAAEGKPPLLARANEGGPREGETLPAVGLPQGDSFVLVQSAARELEGKWVRDGEDRQHPYRLVLALSPDDGALEREPNDDLQTAQTLALPVALRGWIWPRKDVDVFRFHVAAGHEPVSITLGAVRGVDLMLRLLQVHGGAGEVIGSSDSARGEGEEKLLSVPLKEGDYAVEVSSPHHKDASATQPYTLTIQ